MKDLRPPARAVTPSCPEPPRIARWLLERLLSPDVREAILGDLAESLAAGANDAASAVCAARQARLRYWRELLHAPRTWFLPLPRTPFAAPHSSPGDGTVTQLISDVRYALRMMARRTGSTVVAVVTLALGIGASTAIFSAVYPILVKTLPYPRPEQLTGIWERDPGGKSNLGFATFDDLERDNRSFESMAAMGGWSATMTTASEPVQFTGQRVTPAFFHVLGVSPALGRDFRPEDNVRDTPRVVILSYPTWRDAFGADTSIIEKTITLDGAPYRVIGVMPAGFDNVLAPEAQAWTPLRYNLTLPWACRSCRHLRVVARRRAGVTAAQASLEIGVLAANAFRDHPTEYTGLGMMAPPLASDLTSGVRPALLAVLGAVLLLLLVASLNVSNLLLARGASRRGEFAVRVALGADRRRIVRQLLTESLVLAMLGGALGIALAFLGVRGLVALAPPDIPRLSAIAVNGSVLLFAVALTTVIGVVFGLMPAWKASGANLQQEMRQGARHVVGASRITRAVVVVSEVALSLVLLVGSGLLLRSMQRLLAVDPGFEPSGLLTMQVQAGAGRLRNDTLVRTFFDGALEAVRHQPGVASAALTSQLPLSGDFDGYGVHIQSQPSANPEKDPSGFRYAVSDGYFETMRIPLLRGRTFTPRDDAGAVPVAIINAAFARRHFGGRDAVGERVRVGAADTGPWREIVGIVGDVKQVSLEAEQSDAIYLPESQWPFTDYMMSVVVRARGRARGGAAALAPAIRGAVWSLDKDQPISRVATADRLIAATAAQRRFALVLFEAFALVALVLAAAGIYGVLVGTVADRTRELGVRSAFGATAGDLVRMILRQGMRMTAIGIAVGLVLALLGARVITGMLYGVSNLDPVTYAAVTAMLLLVALAACWIPAARAARVDPMVTLRND